MDIYIKREKRFGRDENGESIVIEIDESIQVRQAKISKRPSRGTLSRTLEMLNELPQRRCFFQVVERRDARTLEQIIRTWVRPGSKIVTDCSRAYDVLERLPENNEHETVNHSIEGTHLQFQ